MENQNQYLKHILLEFQSAEKGFLLYVLNEIKKFNLKHSILQIKLQRSFTKKEKLFYEFLNHFNNFNSKNSLKKNIFFWNELGTIFYNELYFNCNLLIYQFLGKAFNELNSRYLGDTISYQYIENLSFSNLYHNLEECEDKVSFGGIHSTAHRQFGQLLDGINFFEKMLNNFEKNKKLQKEFKYFIYFIYLAQEYYLGRKQSKIKNYELEGKIKSAFQEIQMKIKNYEKTNKLSQEEILICKNIFEIQK